MARTVAAATPASAPPPPTASVFDLPAQRYDERAELGRGGMGRVVEAHDRALDRAVAIKQSLAASPTDLARFEREVRITAKLQHPSVVPIHDVGRDAEGRPYYVMRKVDGEPLAHAIARAEDVRARLALVPSLLGAIDACAYAHARGVVHRDIKPWNILLGPYGETLLIDWGIARELDEADVAPELEPAATSPQLTRVGSAYGTPGFLSPEQARGEGVDARTDVYSLGATLYYILTRAVPFGVDRPTEAIEAVAAGASPDFATIPAEVPRELVAITAKAMDPAPAARYADAGELAADVRRFLAGQLVAAHEYTTGERFRRWLRRHRLAAAISAIAIVTIAVISTVAVTRVVAERDDATAAKVAEAAARERAERSADAKLVDRARSLLATDPTSALGVLRTLRPESPAWTEIRPFVRAAMSSGVERSLGRLRGWVSGLAVSPDGTRVAAGGANQVTIYGGATERSVPVDATELYWRDARTVVYLRESDRSFVAGTIDAETGAVTRFELGTLRQVEPSGSDLILLDDAGAVTRIDAAGTRHTLLATGAVGIATRSGRIAIAERARITILDGATSTAIEVPAPILYGVRISTSGTRVLGLAMGLAREWTIGAGGPRSSWPRPTTGLASIEYAEERPLAWTSARGVEALEPAGARLQWMVRERKPGVLTDHILPVRRGAVLVTDGGEIALATAVGIVPLPHRPVAVTRAAVDPSGEHLLLGTDLGEVLQVDLSAAWPTVYPVEPGTRLAGIGAGRILIDDGTIRTIDLASGARRDVAPHAAQGELVGEPPLVLRRDYENLELIALDGKVLLHEEQVRASYTSLTTLTYVKRDGAVWQLALASPGARRQLASLGDISSTLVVLDAVDEDVMMTIYASPDPATAPRTVLFANGTRRELPLAAPGYVDLQGRTADGAYWMVVIDDGSLRRVAPDGTTTTVSTGYRVSSALVSGDRVWAFGPSTMTELAQDGTVVRTLGMRHAGAVLRVPGGVVMGDTDGVVELAPRLALRRVLRAPGTIVGVVATGDGKSIAASLELDDERSAIAVWWDPVPPDGMRAYLDRVTNARLLDGSDAVTWDAPRAP